MNSGTFGYGVSQELLGFLEETSYFKLHIVVMLSGINEVWSYIGDPAGYAKSNMAWNVMYLVNFGRPFSPPPLLPYVARLAYDLGRPKVRPPSEVYGFANDRAVCWTAMELYVRKLRQFKALCDEAGAQFVFCLQPSALYVKAADEQTKANPFQDAESIRAFSAFYNDVISRFTEPWQVDLTGLFDLQDAVVYRRDGFHYTDEGNRLLAEWMFSRVRVMAEAGVPGNGTG